MLLNPERIWFGTVTSLNRTTLLPEGGAEAVVEHNFLSGERPVNPALWWVNGKGEEVKWSFQELGSLSRKAANVLTKPCGLQRGDRVAVILPRIPEWWLINVACIRTGTTQLTRKDILYRLQSSKAKCIVTSEEVAPAVDSIVSECPNLKTKLLVSPHHWEGWLSFQELLLSNVSSLNVAAPDQLDESHRLFSLHTAVSSHLQSL
ncbi:hypothetical protein STEG23_023127 [Scotinomys teguina]